MAFLYLLEIANFIVLYHFYELESTIQMQQEG